MRQQLYRNEFESYKPVESIFGLVNIRVHTSRPEPSTTKPSTAIRKAAIGKATIGKATIGKAVAYTPS